MRNATVADESHFEGNAPYAFHHSQSLLLIVELRYAKEIVSDDGQSSPVTYYDAVCFVGQSHNRGPRKQCEPECIRNL